MIEQSKITLSINDFSGFEGRVDAIYLTQKQNDQPPVSKDALELFRRKMLHLPKQPKEAGTYDLVIAGGGVAGTCAAIQAARLGLKVCLLYTSSSCSPTYHVWFASLLYNKTGEEF